jgi:hypothetical protein
MATPMTAEQFVRQLNLWRVPFVEAPGWRTRNRNAAGDWGPVRGVLLHHTGDDGVAVLIGWGRANHAGKGSAAVRVALVTENYDDYPPKPGPDNADGNAIFYGQETCYGGAKAPTTAAYLATVRIFAAVCHWHAWSGKSCIGHKEWTSRKVDPGHLDMATFRQAVDAALHLGPAAPTKPTTKPAPKPTTTPSTNPVTNPVTKPPSATVTPPAPSASALEVDMRVVRTPAGDCYVINGPLSAYLHDAALVKEWCVLTGQVDAKGDPAPAPASVALVETTVGIADLARRPAS